MSYCHDKGISHSHYLGGPQYWTDEDRVKNTAYALERALQCPRCRTADWEWDEDPHAFEAVVEFCLTCSLREAAHEQNKTTVDRPGYSITMMPRATATAMRNRQRSPVNRVKRRRELRAQRKNLRS